MNILVGCEESGVVAAAFRRLGHDAWSCDLLPTRGDPAFHFQTDIFEVITRGSTPWDMGVFFPPCTHLAGSGARWLTDHWVHRNGCPGFDAENLHYPVNGFNCRWHSGAKKRAAQKEAVKFVQALWSCGIPRIAIENPVGMLSSLWCKPDQIIQPWQFGHGEQKGTCLWLSNLPKLIPTKIVEGREQRIWLMPPGPDRQRERSKTFQGIADAMAQQWG